ncbi:uncharacterized protein DSM5745_06515 [Aspergillus mulundensis]|uniref:NADH:flavin oxidoreductase/NADH oxidase N-terminal domain-containing protein n=1 Tax=Aspergillus mulundensis TaxID=1810919 RepID=A0A3D8RR17_9EURO|nr:Uncharacterized protein DSM5745_06515 [Aspergillus mulundensis]RDW76523.1 Uncharacterized protein DSM5745_06515 [Aspergillus mulundensis]
MAMTCAANVHPLGKTFPGQLGIHADKHDKGLKDIADAIRKHGGVSSVQIHHGGVRANPDALLPPNTMVGLGEGERRQPVGPSAFAPTGARALGLDEVAAVRDEHIGAAVRAQKAGFDGVEVHGAFGWLVMQFLSPVYNERTDCYGGSVENRARFLFEILDGIRRTCHRDFQIGLRISMERYGVPLADLRAVVARAMREGKIDYLDLAMWDYRKVVDSSFELGPSDMEWKGRTLLSLFTEIPRHGVAVGASGHVMSARQAVEVLEAGCDFVMLGKGAILDPDLPRKIREEGDWRAPGLPVTAGWLRENARLSERFIDYMRTWDGFVSD